MNLRTRSFVPLNRFAGTPGTIDAKRRLKYHPSIGEPIHFFAVRIVVAAGEVNPTTLMPWG